VFRDELIKEIISVINARLDTLDEGSNQHQSDNESSSSSSDETTDESEEDENDNDDIRHESSSETDANPDSGVFSS
jgi:hypothetical protein